jgi:hypothetical protein
MRGWLTRRRPEMNNPFDVTTLAKMVQFEASEIWVYDGATGIVYVRVKLPKML